MRKMSQDISNTLIERGNRYGVFKEHSRITQNLKIAMQDSPNWVSLSKDKKEALEMIQHKIGRILNGDPEYTDSWHDIIGYAKLVEDDLNSGKDKDLTIGLKPGNIVNVGEDYWCDKAFGLNNCAVNVLRIGEENPSWITVRLVGTAREAEVPYTSLRSKIMNLNTKDYIKCGALSNAGYQCTQPAGHTGYHEARLKEGSAYPDDKWLEGTPVNFSSEDYIKCLVDGGTGRPCQRPINHSGMHEEGANRWD